MKRLRVTVDGKSYEVSVEILDPGADSAPPLRTASVSAPVTPAPAAPAAGAGGPGDVASPLAGKIVAIAVKAGDAVESGAQVATIEAMKMNTYIFAPKSGRVTQVLVNPGDGVDEGAILLKIA